VSTVRRSTRVPATQARGRILGAARELLLERPFAELTVDAVMARAGLARTVFYRHYRDLAQMAPDLLPDSDVPLVEHAERLDSTEQMVRLVVAGQVAVYAEHGPLLRAIDDAARHDPEVAERLEAALRAPRALLERLVAAAPDPPPDPREFARLLMATHRAYLLDTFGDGRPRRGARRAATEALTALWARLLA
jgi:TetR/AcrR family transcriptional regulator, ethionamide resistance regulator